MKSENSLYRTLLWSMMLTAFLSVGGLGAFWCLREYREYREESRIIRENYIRGQEDRIREEVEKVLGYIDYMRGTTEEKLKENIRLRVKEALSLAENLYQTYRESRNPQEIGEMIREALRPLRFNQGRGYYFVYDMKGSSILLPFSPQLERKNLWDLQDSKGLYTIRRFISMIQEKQEGFLRWHWYKPGNTEYMSEKIGFAAYFAPLDWWIGSGEYTEDTEKDIQQECLDWINKVRFGKDGYIFVYDFDANTLAHYKAENIGINQWNFSDPNGLKVLQELIRLSREKNGGYLRYVGTIRPSTGLAAYKLSYARAVPDWKWMVGTGVYIDEIESILAQKRADMQKSIRKDMLVSAAILTVLMLLIAAVSGLISGKIIRNFRVFSDFFKKSVREYIPIQEEKLCFSEFRELAASANRMIEERNRAKAVLKKMEEDLQRSQKMESLGRLAGGVAHDLNNVLSGTVSYPDLILMDLPEDSPIRKPVLTMKKSGLKAAAIVQDLLSLARGGIPQQDIVNLNRIIREYLDSPEHQNLLRYHPDIRISSRLCPNLLNTRGSRSHLKKVVANLISNAAEAMKEGGVITVSTENRYIDRPFAAYDSIREGEYCVLRVEDQGPGISPEEKEQIFEPFYSKKIMGRSGTGLGMAVVWGTVHDHGGYIHLENLEERGTVFEIYFFVSREAEEDKSISLESFSGNGESVLVVDDMEDQREIAGLMLEKLRYRVQSFADGESAVEWLKENKADLLLLDMIMDPGIDGLETYKRIIEIHPGQKAVIASGFAETERVKAAKELGAGRYLRKPYTFENLAKAVKEELERE